MCLTEPKPNTREKNCKFKPKRTNPIYCLAYVLAKGRNLVKKKRNQVKIEV